MEKLFNLKENAIESLVESTKEIPSETVLEAIKIAVNQMPCDALNIAKYISLLVESDSSRKAPISAILTEEAADECIMLSKLIYLKYLGARVVLSSPGLVFDISPISNIFADIEITAEVPAAFAKRKRVEDGNHSDLDVFLCYAIIRNICFYKLECCYRLKGFSNAAIIEAILVDEPFAAIGIAVELCKTEGFFMCLAKHIELFTKRAKIVALIFVSYYRIKPALATDQYVCMQSDEERQRLRAIFDSESEQLCRRIGNLVRLNVLLGTSYCYPSLPVMSRAEFSSAEFADKASFFRAFLALASPSVTHFLSYLEEYKEQFKLSNEEQKLFVELIKEFHSGNELYSEIVLAKLGKFRIVSAEYL